MARATLLPLLALAACGGATLQDFHDSALSMDLDESGLLRVQLGDAQGDCPTLGAVTATVNGVALACETHGGQAQSTSGWICEPPSFSVALSALAGDDAALRLEDHSAVITVSARNLLAGRKLSRVVGDDGLIFSWEPVTDQPSSASFRLDGTAGSTFGEATLTGVQLEIPLASDATGVLTVDGLATAPILECTGVASCVARVSASSGAVPLSAATF